MAENKSNFKTGKLTAEGYFPVTISTNRGKIDCRYYRLADEKLAVVYVGGVGGGFDTPAKGLYPKLCQSLLPHGISGLRIKFRFPTDLAESVFDVMTGVSYLQSAGIRKIGLIGHSFGGAVVIQSGTRLDIVKTIITLSTQSYGTDEVSTLQGKSLLLIHGALDEVLSPKSSLYVYKMAPEPKRIVWMDRSRHVLDEQAEEVYSLVFGWLLENLK